MPSEPPTVGPGALPGRPETPVPSEELERVRQELAGVMAEREREAQERARAEAFATAVSRYHLPAELLGAVADYVPTEAVESVAKALAAPFHSARQSTGVGRGGLTPYQDPWRADWSGLFRSNR